MPFLCLFLVQLGHHQKWRDELNAWGIAAASPNLATLFHYVQYEGHPWVWYGVLWPVTKITPFPLGMRVLQGVIGSAIYLMIGLASPFRWREKVLLFLSYFVCFEYTVIARMYGLVLLLVLAYLWLITRRSQQRLLSYAILGLIANADLTGIVVSSALLLERAVRERWWTCLRQPRNAEIPAESIFRGLALYGALLLFSIVSLWPAKDISTRTTGSPFRNRNSIELLRDATLNGIVMPYFPVATAIPYKYWNPEPKHHKHKFPFAVPLVLFAYWATLRKRLNLWVLVGWTTLLTILISDLIYTGSMRHFGMVFISFLACLWLLKAGGKAISPYACGLLGLVALGGIVAQIDAWRWPFSNAQATALWIQQSDLAQLPLTGSPDSTVIGPAEVLHRPIYLLECQCVRTFLLFSKERDFFSDREIPQRLAAARLALKSPEVLFLGVHTFTPEEEKELRAEHVATDLVARFQGSEQWGEDFFVYKVHGTD